jgi:hypothetical protein
MFSVVHAWSVSTAKDFPTMHREQTEHREHRAHPSMAWTTESATPLIPADTLPGPPARNTVSGRTLIWRGDFERVHCQSSPMHTRMNLSGSRYLPIHHHLHKLKKRPSLSCCPQLAKKLSLLLHAYPLTTILAFFALSSLPFSLSSSRTLSSDGETG